MSWLLTIHNVKPKLLSQAGIGRPGYLFLFQYVILASFYCPIWHSTSAELDFWLRLQCVLFSSSLPVILPSQNPSLLFVIIPGFRSILSPTFHRKLPQMTWAEWAYFLLKTYNPPNSHCSWEYKNWSSPLKNNLAICIKGCKTVHTLLYIIIPFLGIFPKGNKPKSRKNFGLKMFITAIKRQREKEKGRGEWRRMVNNSNL